MDPKIGYNSIWSADSTEWGKGEWDKVQLMKTSKISRYSVLNAINEKYNLQHCEITSQSEAYEFGDQYIGPLADMAPVFFDPVDAEICATINDYWSEIEELNKLLPPLLAKSTFQFIKKSDK